jgi:hypothetical protein
LAKLAYFEEVEFFARLILSPASAVGKKERFHFNQAMAK